MKKTLIAYNRIMWLLFLILPGIVHAGYLKSTGNLKVLEGETCYLRWDAYSNEAAGAPCSWWHSGNKTEDPRLFLAYEDGRRYDFGDGSLWRFMNIQEPCSGGLQKTVTLDDAGVYSMQTENGLLQKTDSEIALDVFKGSDLSFLVYVNGKVNNLDLNKHTWTLKLLKTNSPVNVSVVLSTIFPSTTVITISNGEEVSCDDPHKRCYQVTDLNQRSDVSIVIKIETEIIGASQILITQPLAYSANRAKNVFAALFFLLLIIDIIIIIIIIIWYVRKTRQASKQADVENGREKMSLKQRVKNIKSDIFGALQVNNQPGYDEVVKIYKQQCCLISTLEKKVRQDQEKVNSEIKLCKNYLDDTLLLTNDLIQKYQEMYKKMADNTKEMERIGNLAELNLAQHEQYEVTKLLMKLVKEIETRLNCIDNCCTRFKMKKILQKEANSNDQKPEAEVEEEDAESTEKTGMINENIIKLLEDVLEQKEKIMDLKCEQVKLEEMLKETQVMRDCIRGESDIINDAGKQITEISKHFDKIQKGWEYSQEGSSAAASKSKEKVEKKSSKKEKKKTI